jgi:hypothetical protein
MYCCAGFLQFAQFAEALAREKLRILDRGLEGRDGCVTRERLQPIRGGLQESC